MLRSIKLHRDCTVFCHWYCEMEARSKLRRALIDFVHTDMSVRRHIRIQRKLSRVLKRLQAMVEN